jgi:hypothetical protein
VFTGDHHRSGAEGIAGEYRGGGSSAAHFDDQHIVPSRFLDAGRRATQADSRHAFKEQL